MLRQSLIICILRRITLHDYVASILGTNQIETNWFLDPMKEINSTLGGKVERGTGNVCAVEFNLLYRVCTGFLASFHVSID